MRRYALVLAAVPLIAGFCTAGTAAAISLPARPASTAASDTALTLSAPSIAFGDEQDELLTVTVSGGTDAPTGTVTVSEGAVTVCTIILADGTGSCAPAAEEFAVGPVTLTAAYGGDDNYDLSTSAPATLQVTSPAPPPAAATTTTMQLSRTGLTYGDEQAETVSVTVAAPVGGAIPDGAVTVKSGTVSICAFGLSAAGSGSCVLKATALPPGRTSLTASYAGDATFAASASGAAPVTVAKEPAATAVSLSAAKVSYGAEQHEHIAVAVKPAFGGTPTGHVTVRNGKTAIGVITLKSAKGSYNLAAASLPGGTAKLTASYSGDAHFAGSASATKKLTIAKASSKTTLVLSAAGVTFGAEQRERVTVAVKPAFGGIPTGHVTIKAGKTTLCLITLKSGKGACAPAATRLVTGRYKVTADYGGNGDLAASASAARILSVARAGTKVTMSLSKANVTYGHEGAEKVAVRVTPHYAGTPTGTVTVRANGAKLAVIRLKSGKGSFTLSAKELAAGDYTLVASYSGAASFAASPSGKKPLTVSSPPPPKPACYPLSNEGTCYEPGEFCRTSDHGKTGIAGDGERIICEDNNGWRWEPY